MKKNKNKLILGIILIIFNEILIFSKYFQCLSIPKEYNITCTIMRLDYGFLYSLGRHFMVIIGIVLIVLWVKQPNVSDIDNKSQNINVEDDAKELFIENADYDEDLEDMYSIDKE